eukprot:2691771-Lingulodinium_polyedra.AAC.1
MYVNASHQRNLRARATKQWADLGLPRHWQGLLISIGLVAVETEAQPVSGDASLLALTDQDKPDHDQA